ncbi:MAG: aspartate--ammonia ligase [Spirochaetaceae bacterium]|jgi:aspartate--ammonia ligase|nr:aspartate--ammonia ligase [Spirochaetaceae bacterium]
MSHLYIPENYTPLLSLRETEHAIVLIKDFFQMALSTELNLTRVTAPLFVPQGTGLNDDLNGVERAVTFPVRDMGEQKMEIVHSLAKWKRVKITDMELPRGFGIYTDMNAIRADEELDNIHSLYVDQWDWEMVIGEEDRQTDLLKDIVRKIYRCLKRTEFYLYDRYPAIVPVLPEEITFIHAEELLEKYPGDPNRPLSPRERETAAAREYGAIFIIGIGAPLSDGEPHDGRAPDYDDWITETADGRRGLNGDLIVWNSVLNSSLELSSMGIRVSPASLRRQLDMRSCPERSALQFHSKLLNGELACSIGGGIGQSRLCMYFLRKVHIGETQVSSWPEEMKRACREAGIPLL